MNLLLVEDDEGLREGLVELLSDFVEVTSTDRADEALAALESKPVDLVLADGRIGGDWSGGKRVVQAARARFVPVILVTGADADLLQRSLGDAEPDVVLGKPFPVERLLSEVERFLQLRRFAERLVKEGFPQRTGRWTPMGPGLQRHDALGSPGYWLRLESGTTAPTRRPCGVVVVEGRLRSGERIWNAGDFLYLSGGSSPPLAEGNVLLGAVSLEPPVGH